MGNFYQGVVATLVSLLCLSVQAAPLTKSKFRSELNKKKNTVFSMTASLSTLSNAYDPSSSLNYGETNVSLTPYLKLANGISMFATVGAKQVHVDERQSEVNNTSLGLSLKPVTLSKNWIWSNTLVGVLPTNYRTKQLYSFMGSSSYTTGLNQKAKILDIPFSVNYSLVAKRNFHEFSRSSFDSANIMQSGTALISLSKSFLKERLRIALSGSGSLNETYQGRQSNSFSLNQSISYVVIPKNQATLSLGHSNAGDVYKPDGETSNIDFFNERSSSFFGALSYTF